MKKMSRPARWISAAIIAIILLIGYLNLAKSPSEAEGGVLWGTKNQILLLGLGAEPATLDPHLATGVTEHKVFMALFEGLVRAHPKTAQPIPGVAERWKISEDGKTYTFYLRENAKWSNGDPVRATDFVFAYQRMLSAELGAPYAYMLHVIRGAARWNKGELKDPKQLGVLALGPKVLQIVLERPVPYFLQMLLHFAWYPLHPETLKAHKAERQRDTPWIRPGNLVGNGPFVLKAWRLHDVLKLDKNPHYWGAERVALNGIHMLPIDDVHAQERAFRDGQLHATSGLPLSKVSVYRQRKAPELYLHRYLGTYYYLLNTQREPLGDVRVRKALSMALDRKQLCEFVLKGGQEPAFHFTPPGTAGFTTEARVSQNVTEAQKLLKDAGFQGGKNFPKLQLLYNTSENHKLIAEAIGQMWKRHLNIDVELINQDWKVYLSSRNKEDYDIARAAWIGDYEDPSTFLDLFSGASGNNNTGWKSRRYDGWLSLAADQSDKAKRYKLLQQAERVLLEELPIIPIYFYVNTYLLHPDVQGWEPNILDWHPYSALKLQSDAAGER